MCKEKTGNINGYICKDCYENMDIINKEVSMDSPYIKKVYYSLFYNRFIREKVKEFKFNGKTYLCKAFGEIMSETIIKEKIYEEIDMVAFVPTHRRKEALRGYNQAELLAKHISKKINKPLLQGSFIKVKWTKDQSHSDKADRIINLRDSFQIREPKEIEGKTVLLVDDIITTGVTMEECSRVLMNNGAKAVVGLALTSSKKN